MQDLMLWNAVLTLAVGAFLWWIRGTNSDITTVSLHLIKRKRND